MVRKKRTRKTKSKKKVVSKASKPSFLAGPIHKTKIKVIGIGGGGGTIVSEMASNMSSLGKKKVSFVAANTDLQSLKSLGRSVKRFQFGQSLTNGLGCGMNSGLGKTAAQNEKERVSKLFKEIDFTILVGSLGGGTGSGASPVFAESSQANKNITFGIFTLPFKFEGKKKMKVAEKALEELKPNLNALTVIPNEKIFQIIDKKASFQNSLSSINKILAENLESLVEMIYKPGMINIDYADLKTIFDGKDKIAYLATAKSQGSNRAETAVKSVLKSPLSRYSMQGRETQFLVDRILFNIVSSNDLGLAEVEQISKAISDFNRRAKIIFGLQFSFQPEYKNKIKISLLAVGREKTIPEKRVGKAKKPKLEKKPQLKSVKPKKKRKKPSSAPKKKKAKKIKKIVKKKPSLKIFKEKKTSSVKKPKTSEVLPKIPKQTQSEKTEKVRRNALEIKKEVKETEEKLLKQEKFWETPAFLRKLKPIPRSKEGK
ncbi:cell division protein FtsZ [Patescibacteria group bacterium]